MFLTSIPNSNKDFSVIMNYVCDGADKDSDFTFHHNLPGISREEIIQEFSALDKKRTKTKSAAMHEVFSFHPDDSKHISDEMLLDLCQFYVQRRCPLGLAYGRVHRGTRCLHVHLVLSSITLEEKERSTSIRKWDFIRLHKELENRQIEKHGLIHSVVHDKSKRKKKELSPYQTRKKFMHDTAALCAEKATCLADFAKLMQEYDEIEVYSKRDTPNFGAIYRDHKQRYRFSTLLPPEKYELLKELDELQLIRRAALEKEQQQEMEIDY